MKFKFNNFILTTKHEVEKLSEQIAVAQAIDSKNKPCDFKFEFKQREFLVFKKLSLLETKDNKYYDVIYDIFDLIDLIELLKSFNSKKLDINKEYNINNKFIASVARKNDIYSLKILFKNYSYSLFLDSFECSSLAAKFSKILAKCEAWQEQNG